MRAFLSLSLSVAWTFAILRLLSFRSTVSHLTLGLYACLGLLLGPTVVLILHRFVNPYSEPTFPYSPLVITLLALLTIVILILPIVGYLIRRRVHRILSVADIFLLGFGVGAGFDLLGLLLTLPPPVLTWFPPWQGAFAPVAIGMGYRTGLVALVLAAGLRFSAGWYTAAGAASGAALLMAVDAGMPSWRVAADAPSIWNSLRGALTTLTSDGSLTAWFVLAAAVAAQLWEHRKVSVSDETNPISELTLLAGAMRTLNFREYRRIRLLYRLQREREIGEFEQRRYPDDPALSVMLPRLRERIAAIDTAPDAEPPRAIAEPIRVPWAAVIALPWIFLIGIVYWPGGGTRFVAFALAVWTVWWYITSPDRLDQFAHGDDVAAFYSRRAILNTAIAAAVLVAVAGLTGPLVPLVATAFKPAGVRPEIDGDVFLMLLATGAASLTVHARSRWIAQPWVSRRPLTVHRMLMLASVFLAAWTMAQIYTWSIPKIHERWGIYIAYMASVDPKQDRPADMPGWAKRVKFNQRSPFGNNLPAWLMGSILTVGGFAVMSGLRKLVLAAERRVLSGGQMAPEETIGAGG